MKQMWRMLSAAGLLGLMLCVGAVEHGAPMLPGFAGAMLCVAAFGLGAKRGGLMYE